MQSKAYYANTSCVSFIPELNDQRQGRCLQIDINYFLMGLLPFFIPFFIPFFPFFYSISLRRPFFFFFNLFFNFLPVGEQIVLCL